MFITYKEFLDKYLGQSKGYPDGSYIGECLSIVKLYIKECFGINPPPSGSGSAYGYWSNFPSPLGNVFEKVENTDTLIPEKGWIAVWEPWSANQYGHIAIVADGCTTSTLKNYAQNWTSKTFQLESNRYTNVIGFLKPKITNSETIMTEEQKRILDFLAGKTEGDVREAFGALNDSPEKDKQIQTLQEKVLSLDNFVKTLEDRIVALESDLQANLALVEDWQKKYESANKLLKTKQEELDAMTASKNQYKGWYETALTKTIDKFSAWELINMGIKKLIVKK
jgi:hypothetical protein